MWALLATLATLAISIGAQHAIDAINRAKLEKQKVTPATVTMIVDEILGAARSKGQTVYDKVVMKLSDMPFPAGSSIVQDKIREEKRRLTKLRDEASELANKANEKANSAASVASSFSMLSDHEKGKLNQVGSTAHTLKSTATELAGQGKQYYEQLSNIEKQI